MSREYLDDLNSSQRRAVTYGVPDSRPFRSGPLAVVAGAGPARRRSLHRGRRI
jgi:hypothetical protein